MRSTAVPLNAASPSKSRSMANPAMGTIPSLPLKGAAKAAPTKSKSAAKRRVHTNHPLPLKGGASAPPATSKPAARESVDITPSLPPKGEASLSCTKLQAGAEVNSRRRPPGKGKVSASPAIISALISHQRQRQICIV
ncbi:MAG: hypothetical protein JWR00_285, partial [Rubritepida sp.]|nr:hypothetical protein [Rubritepida sp.]